MMIFFFFSSRRRHTRCSRDWSSDVCSSDLDDGLLDALAACAAGDARRVDLHASNAAAVTVVIAAGSYPAAGDAGSPIAGIDEAEATGALVFHAGTALHEDALVTNGGRILGVTATGPTLGAARDR